MIGVAGWQRPSNGAVASSGVPLGDIWRNALSRRTSVVRPLRVSAARSTKVACVVLVRVESMPVDAVWQSVGRAPVKYAMAAGQFGPAQRPRWQRDAVEARRAPDATRVVEPVERYGPRRLQARDREDGDEGDGGDGRSQCEPGEREHDRRCERCEQADIDWGGGVEHRHRHHEERAVERHRPGRRGRSAAWRSSRFAPARGRWPRARRSAGSGPEQREAMSVRGHDRRFRRGGPWCAGPSP